MPYIDALSAIEDLGDGYTWFKLAFDIAGVEVQEHVLSFEALANSPLGTIGFGASVPLMGWNNQDLIEGTLAVDWGRIILRSIGAPTDGLLRVLEQQFKAPESSESATAKISCGAVLLGDDPSEMQCAEIHAKLFFDSFAEHDPRSYAELYFNFDVRAGRAYLMEKDSFYRAPLLKWFAGQYRCPEERVH